jgi:hypothetical protein
MQGLFKILFKEILIGEIILAHRLLSKVGLTPGPTRSPKEKASLMLCAFAAAY